MNHTRRTWLSLLLLSAVTLALPAQAAHRPLAYVLTLSNAVEGNEVLVFAHRHGEGLVQIDSVATGGTGSGGGLGNQGALITSKDRHWLFGVNAGSNSVSAFRVTRNGLVLTDTVDSGGQRPVSVTQHDDLLYVLNAGSDSIAGFRIGRHGKLSPLSNSVRSLSGVGTSPAQISFTPWGDTLVVTEKATQTITTFKVDGDGLPGPALANPSVGATPFGFAFDRFGHLLVTEAAGGAPDASSVSSYNLEEDGSLAVLDPSVPTTESAACWLATSHSGRLAFTTNTGSSSISALKVNHAGELTLLDPDGVAASTGAGSSPIDLALARNGRLMYALSASTGEISVFFVSGSSKLRPLQGSSGLPTSATGMATL